MTVCAARCVGFVSRAVRGFRPRGRVTFLCGQESNQRNRPCKTAPAGCPAMLELRGSRRTRFATLRSDNVAKSVVEACFARASESCASRRFRRGVPRTANSQAQQPASGCISLAPLSPAEERKVLRPRAQHASRTDSARLFEQSVAARVPGGASRLEYRRAPEAQRRAGRSGGALCLLSGGTESRSPAGAKSRHDTSQQEGAA